MSTTEAWEPVFGKAMQNTGLVISSKVMRGLLEIAASVLLARYLGAGDFGMYAFVIAYLGFFSIITNLGIENILVRDISQDRQKTDRYVGTVVTMKLCLSLCAVVLACSVISFLRYPHAIKLLAYLASLQFLLSIRSVYSGIFQANMSLFYPSLIETLSGILKFVLYIALIIFKASIASFIVVGLAVNVCALISLQFFSRRMVRPRLGIEPSLWKYFFRESWPLALTIIFGIILMRIDQIMLFQMKGRETAGFYAAAVQLSEAFTIIIVSFMIPLFPVMADYYRKSSESFKEICGVSYKYALMFVVPLALGVSILSSPIIRLVYEQKFLASSGVLSLLIWSEVSIFFGAVLTHIMVVMGKQKLNLIFTASSALANVVLNVILIPPYGAKGAALATVFSYAGICILSLFLKITRPYSLLGWKALLRPLVASLVMGFYLYYTRSMLIVSVSGGVVIFFAVMLLLRGINRQDLRILSMIFKRTAVAA